MPKPTMTNEMYENTNFANIIIGSMSGMDKYLKKHGEGDLLNRLGSYIDEITIQGKSVGPDGITYSGNGSFRYEKKYTDKEVEGHKKFGQELKVALDKIVNNLSPEEEPFKGYFKCHAMMLDPSWNYYKFRSETPYMAIENIFTGNPNMTEFSAEEMKTVLGSTFAPMSDLYDAVYDFFCLEKELQTNPDMDEKKKKEFTEKRIANLDRMTADFDKLYETDEATRKRLTSKYLQNHFDHMIGKEKKEDRSPLADIEAMKVESAALKKGFSLDEARGIAVLGFAKGRIKRANFELEESIKEAEADKKKAKADGIQKLSAEDIKEYERIKKKETDTTREERDWIHAHSKAYYYTMADKHIAQYKAKIDNNEHYFNRLNEVQEHVLKKDPKNAAEKQKAFNEIEKYFDLHTDYVFSGRSKTTFGSVKRHHQYIIDKAKAGIENEIKNKFATDYDNDPKLRQETFLSTVSSKLKYKGENATELVSDALKQFEKEGKKIEAPEKYADFNSEAFQKTINDVVDRAGKYPAGLAKLDEMNRLIVTSKSDLTVNTLAIVSRGKKIGFRGKEDYENIEKKLTEFKHEKELREKRLTDGYSFDKRIKVTSKDGKQSINYVLDERIVEKEKEILDMMDKYIARKDKEIKEAGKKAKKNSIKRRDEMVKARKLFKEQYEADKKLVENKEEYKKAHNEVEIYEGRKKAEKIALENSKLGKKAMKEVEALKTNPAFRKFDELIKKEEQKVAKTLNDVTLSDVDEYFKDRNVKLATRKSVFDSACRTLYISAVKEAFADKITDDKSKDYTAEINTALKEANIQKGAKLITDCMDVLVNFKADFAIRITELGLEGHQSKLKAENEKLGAAGEKEANTLSCSEVRNTLDTMLRGALKASLTNKDANKSKPVIEALDQVALATGSNVNSKTVMEEIKLQRRNEIKLNSMPSKKLGD